MRFDLIAMWLFISIFVVSALGITWLQAHDLDEQKIRLIHQLTELDRITAAPNDAKNIVIIGTSLTKTGFSRSDELKKKLAQRDLKTKVTKVVVGSGSTTELEPAIIAALDASADLILVEVNPWTLSFGPGHKVTHHRRWISTRFLLLFGIEPKRYSQQSTQNNAEHYTADRSSVDARFSQFTPQYTAFSSMLQSKLVSNNSATQNIRFFYPNWSRYVNKSKGKDWQSALKNIHLEAERQTGISFFPDIPSLASEAYTDHVHANKLGREHYDKWLINNLKAFFHE